jgi:superoxide reductase
MADKLEMYKCADCGAIFEVIVPCDCEACDITCCGGGMELLEANTVDAATEKHVPVIEKTATGYKVTVGSVAHPMLEEHYIQFIELIADGRSYKAFLNPGDAPEAEFCLKASAVTAREHCNLHGLWEASTE